MSTFSKINFKSDLYSKFRPVYTKTLFSILYDFHNQNDNKFGLVADVGTGTGQVAVELAKKYENVYGIDNSSNMISNAVKLNNIKYIINKAEELPFKDNTIDAITVSQAFHWFNHDIFFNEAKRVLKPNGTLAIFGYSFVKIKNNNEASEIIKNLGTDIFNNYWDNGITFINNLYRDIKFPFSNIKWYITPKCEDITNISSKIEYSLMEKDMTIDEFHKYIKTWSAYFNYMSNNKNVIDPVDVMINKIYKIMKLKDKNDIISVEWPVVLILIKNEK